MRTASRLDRLLAQGRQDQASALRRAALAAAVAAGASAALLGLAGWFIAAAALAGLSGSVVAFNYVLPSAAIRLFAILRTGGRYVEQVGAHQAALGVLARIRPAVFAAIAAAPPERALRLSAGEASAHLTQDVDALEMLVARLPGRWAGGGAIVCGLALVGLAGWASVATTALFALVAAGGGLILSRRLEADPGREARQAAGRLEDRFAGMALAASELRCLGLESWAADVVGAEAAHFERAKRRLAVARGWRSAMPAALAGLAAAVTLGVAAPAGAALALLAGLVAGVTVEGAGALAWRLADDAEAKGARARLDPWLEADRRLSGEAAPAAVGDIELDLPGRRLVLRAGMRAALVGASGSGKTTWLERLVGLRPPPPGAVRISGQDLAGLPGGASRRLFAYAPQEPGLIGGAFRDNLRLAAPDADEASMWAALRDADLDERVRAAPDGLDAWVGENGEDLSGGERRRLCLARALMRTAPWLLLDEPTEGLDAASEMRVVQRLSERLQRTGQGLILVSHHAAPLALCSLRAELTKLTLLAESEAA